MKTKKLLLSMLAISTFMIAGCESKNNDDVSKTDSTENVESVKNEYVTDGSFFVGKDGAINLKNFDEKDHPILNIYFDPMCPGCGMFEREAGEYLDEKVKAGDIVIRYYPLMFLDDTSVVTDNTGIQKSDYYSSRTSGYILGTAEYAPEKVSEFISKIFSEEYQPNEEAYIPVTNAQIEAILKEIGVNDKQLKNIQNNLENNMTTSYETTLKVMQSNKLLKESPTGSLYTPFIVPYKAGENSGKALILQSDNFINEAKDAVKQLTGHE